MDFVDHENKISCKIVFGNIKKKPSDYFEGDILVDGKKTSHIFGTCLGTLILRVDLY